MDPVEIDTTVPVTFDLPVHITVQPAQVTVTDGDAVPASPALAVVPEPVAVDPLAPPA